MKQELSLVSLALNNSAPSPLAQMVRASDGYLVAFGGTTCISVPFPSAIDACFNPEAIAPFFRKERKAISYTIKNKKLVLTEGKERLTVGCLAAEELAIIDNFETPIPCTLNLKSLKVAAEVTNLEGPVYAHGVIFKSGMMNATNNKVFFCGESGIPKDIEFAIAKESCVALTKFKSNVISISHNKHTVKFNFESGASLCARQLLCEFPDIGPLFAGKWNDLNLTEDLSDIQCEYLEFIEGSVYYHSKDSVGILENVLDTGIKVSAYKKSFDHLGKIGNKISLSEDKLKLKSVGDKCVVICSVKVKGN